MTLVIVVRHPLSNCKIQGVGLHHTPGVGASHSGSSAPSSRRTKPPFLRRLSPKRARSGCVVERLSLSRCSRNGSCCSCGPCSPSHPPQRLCQALEVHKDSCHLCLSLVPGSGPSVGRTLFRIWREFRLSDGHLVYYFCRHVSTCSRHNKHLAKIVNKNMKVQEQNPTTPWTQTGA